MNNWQALSTLLFVLVFIYYNLIIGRAILRFFKLEHNKALSFMTGIVAVFSISELLGLPFMLLQGSFKPLFILFCFVLGFLFFLCAYYLFIEKKDYSILKLDYKAFENPYFIILIIIVIVSTFVPTIFSKFDGDDSFYIAISTSILRTGRIFYNNPSIGLDEYPFPVHYQFTVYEVLITILSRIFNFDPVVVFHTLIPLVVIPSYFIASYALATAIFPGKEKYKGHLLFCIIIGLLTLFSRYSGFLPGIFLMTRPWMGKTVLVTLIFPVFICYFIYIIRTEKKIYNAYHIFSPNSGYFFLINLCLIAAVATSSVGFYLMPIYYFLLFLSVIISFRNGFTFRVKFNLSVKAFLSVIPIVCLLIGFFVFIQNSGQLSLIRNFETDRTWLQDASLFLTNNYGIILLYFLSVGYFLFFGNTVTRVIFITEPILLLLTFGNPFLHELVATYLTTRPLYWRLFWLIPVFWTIAAFLTETYSLLQGSFYRLIIVIPLIVICNLNNFALNNNNFGGPDNAAKLPEYISSTVSTILHNSYSDSPEDLYLLALPKYNIYLRQYTGNISLVMPRINYVEEAYKLTGKQEEYYKIDNLFTYDEDHIITGYTDVFNVKDLKDLDISLVIAPELRPELDLTFNLFELPNGDYLYIRKDISKMPEALKIPQAPRLIFDSSDSSG